MTIKSDERIRNNYIGIADCGCFIDHGMVHRCSIHSTLPMRHRLIMLRDEMKTNLNRTIGDFAADLTKILEDSI